MADVPWKIDDTQPATPWKIDDTRPADLSAAARSYAVSERPSGVEEFVGGAKHAWDKAAMGLKGIFADLSPEDRQLLEQGKSFVKETGPASTVGEITGDIAPVVALPLGAAATVPRLARALSARGFLPGAARTADVAATQAGVAAALAPENRSEAAAWGAGGGAVGQGIGKVASGIVRPTAAAKELIDRGVTLTPGQAAGVGSLTHRFEQAASSLPIASHFVSNAQRRGVEEANRAAAESVAGIVQKNVKLGLPPREAIEQTRDLVGKTYDEALQGMQARPQDVQRGLEEGYDAIIQGNPLLTDKGFNQLRAFVINRFDPLVTNGHVLDGPLLKEIDSQIGTHIRRLKTSTSAEEKANAGAWEDLQQNLRETMAGMVPKEQSVKLNQANAAYRQLLALERSLPAGSDNFTPRQLKRTLESHRIKGTELNKVADAMSATLPNTVANSGTAERLLMGSLPALLMGGGGIGAQQMGYDTLGAGMIAATLGGSRTGSKLLTGGYGWQQQQVLIDALRRSAPAAARTKDEK